MSELQVNKVKALIVDDEIDVCYLLSGLLKHKNLHADFVNSLEDAKQALQDIQPSIIFLDNHLPDGLGSNFIEYIKQQYPKTKVVMITAHDAPADRDRAYQNGADFFIGKPFSKDIIFNVVENMITRV